MANIDIQILVKSFGLGVYEAQIVPSELVDCDPDDNTLNLFMQFTKIKVQELGLGKLQGIFPNNQGVGSYFIFFDRGHEPSKYEVSMVGDQIGLLKQQIKEGFDDRIKKLEEYYAQIRKQQSLG